MNYILIAVLAVLALGAYLGYRKGIIRIAVSLISMIVSIVACMFVTPALCTWVKANTDVHSKMTASVYNVVISSDAYNSAYSKAVNELTQDSAEVLIADNEAAGIASDVSESGIAAYESQISEYVAVIADAMKLPESVMNNYGSSLTESFGNVVSEKIDSAKELLAAIFAARIADMAINAIIYILVFGVIYVVTRVLLIATGIISALPFIRQANRLVGMAFGFAQALVIVWLVFAVITACGSFEWAQSALAMIGDNGVLTFLYENNFIIKVIA